MAATHTPGPWKAVPTGRHWDNHSLLNIEIHYGEDGECIADTVYRPEDAALIAAAPELLEALKYLEARAKDYAENDERMSPSSILAAITPVIAKAEGRV